MTRRRRFCLPCPAGAYGIAVLLGAASVGAASVGAAPTDEDSPTGTEDPFGGRSRPADSRLEASPAHRDAADRRGDFDQATVDGVYGRFDGDLSLALGAGGELGFDPASPRLLGTLTLRYYSLVGIYAGYREGVRDRDPLARGISAGILLEPLFLLRWTRGATTGSPFWDLTLDSIGISV